MRLRGTLKVIGAHCEGEVGNVVIDGVGDVPGRTMAEKSEYLEHNMDHIRRTLLFEPRGAPYHAANVIFPSQHPEAEFGFALLQVSKYSWMSGNNLICVATVLLEEGMIPMTEPLTVFKLETPAGLIEATCKCTRGRVENVEFRNVPCFMLHSDRIVDVPGIGSIHVDIAYGGVFYAIVYATQLGFNLEIDETPEICRIGKEIRSACQEQLGVRHPQNEKIADVVSVVVAGPLMRKQTYIEAKNATVINRGRVDRCPCGTGTCARLAVMYAKGQIALGEEFHSYSITDTRFIGKVVGETTVVGVPAVVPTIKGRAWITGVMEYRVDPNDPIESGYVLPDVWS
ncbi:MAG: proline racemase family protein [Gammaproteobacteria bacterium]|nr:proline racemase family protein [Gammaproteobacteria bacterium]